MGKSIESIWKEGFLNNNALVAPKLNKLYEQKSNHIVDKFRRMYKINIIAIGIFACLLMPFTILVNMPYMGIPMFFLFVTIIIFSRKFKKQLDEIDTSLDCYEYLNTFNTWCTDMASFNSKMSRYLYPFVLISMTLGFWFGGFGGDIPGQEIVGKLLIEYPNMILLFGLPLIGIIAMIVLLAVLAYFGGRIGKWDLNLVYGGIFKRLNNLLTEMEDLRK